MNTRSVSALATIDYNQYVGQDKVLSGERSFIMSEKSNCTHNLVHSAGIQSLQVNNLQDRSRYAQKELSVPYNNNILLYSISYS